MRPDHRSQPLPPTPLMNGDNTPLDLVTIRATIRRALQERITPPPAREVDELIRALREHLERMLAEAASRATEVPPGTVARDRWDALIGHVRFDLDFGAGEERPIRCAARAYMQILARDARFLADCLDE
ncbi:DUF6415 family natural product biosynthesis protein [Streptomyces orinoci]|uniref:DUF6415 family natural product biosynthesis protein n=1 Tax=Streptomyces orinoci TaxID=67339 RepID=A0ABV3JQE1_STRON|nr:DUF6415 family natural product biosynthesis protein [Streptomyces orinoci]